MTLPGAHTAHGTVPPVGPAELLAAWEAGVDRHEAARALLLHRAARPWAGTDELLSVPVGVRETELLALRRSLFGERMQVCAECGSCGEAMEFDLDAGRLAGTAPPGGPLRVEEGDWVVDFRLPTVADLTAAGAAPGPEEARRVLLERCTVAARRRGEEVPADRLDAVLPVPVRSRLAEAAERADPAADVTLKVTCPECGESTRAELDISSYLWTELDNWARDVLLDVHLLASAYGWTEPEVLALSPLRRRYYLELCADA
ncbi:T4 family baseplate hub assembly chaperone [Streptomyces wuyuanensis]|uniref:T4 family baseplate hub assembly chaperone n=1 Tax=Streptomyces wuyuanensis TaxID=1196353 RepID=UPI003801E146